MVRLEEVDYFNIGMDHENIQEKEITFIYQREEILTTVCVCVCAIFIYSWFLQTNKYTF